MTLWQLILTQSKVNGGVYYGDRLVAQNWMWPKETWFQTRLCELRRSICKYSKLGGNRARNNSNLQQRLDAKFWRSDEHGGMPTGRQLPAR